MPSFYLTVLLIFLSFPDAGHADTPSPVRVTSWNIEHLGSPGRGFGGGFGGYGSGSVPENSKKLPLRSEKQLSAIATFIKEELETDVFALQEVAITNQRLGRSFCRPLSEITDELEELNPEESWRYFLPQVEETPPATEERNTHLGFLWNQQRVRLLKVFEMTLENQSLAGKNLFDRKPLVGYFEEVLPDGSEGQDFVLVNVHLASGQHRDENHLIAMTLIEYEIARNLSRYAINEPSITILGDFNDNPNRADEEGEQLTSPALIQHLEFKGYTILVSSEEKFTRMNSRLNSLIDHVFVNQTAAAQLVSSEAVIYRPGKGKLGDEALFPKWRQTYSDHFPITFSFKSGSDEDGDFFD